MPKFEKSLSTFLKAFACGLKTRNPPKNKIFYTVKVFSPPTPYPWKHVHYECFFPIIKITSKKVSHSAHAFTGKGLIQKWQ